ncbi:MAG: hypothetical protein BECKG1743E_GA0114224_112971 [Candidatus Kentron sp. G]|nr:MAG: hypothetical protein BECKG1743E_GA0114224_112971 [Candidatus Kentron sp. G]
MQKSSCTPNVVENSLEMLIYFPGNCAFSLPNFMTYRASLWDTIRLLHIPLMGMPGMQSTPGAVSLGATKNSAGSRGCEVRSVRFEK